VEHEQKPPAPVALQEVCEEARVVLRQAIDESGATVQWEGLPQVAGNRRQLVQLMQNLIGNAVKYRADRPPVVRVEAIRRPGAWEVAVSDNGIGINEADQQKIFTLFKRLHGRSRYAGTGVGLALCKKIVTLHGGRLWVESRPGAGSTFHFTLADPEAGVT
jgi:signal transduction histidine kinase